MTGTSAHDTDAASGGAAGPAPAAEPGPLAELDGGGWWYFFVLGVRLRWRLVRNRLRKGGIVLFAVSVAVAGAGGLIGFISFAAGGRAFDDLWREAAAVTGVGSLLIGWIVLPLMSGGADETLDPTRLALVPLSRRQLAATMIGGAVSGPATLAVLLACCGLAVGYGRWNAALPVAVLAVPVTFLLGLGVSRLVAALLALATRSRGGRDVAVVIATLTFAAVWLGTQAIGPALERSDRTTVRRLIDVLSWPPTGWPGRALIEAVEGRALPAALWLAGAAVAAGLALVGWARVTARMLHTSDRVIGERAADDRAPLAGATTEWQAAIIRERRYLWRSPGRRAQLVMTTIMGVGFSLVQVVRDPDHTDPRIAFAGLVGMVFAIGPSFNVVGFDAGSLWLEDLTGGLSATRIRARALGWSLHAVLPGVLGAVAVSAVAGLWGDTLLAIACIPGLALGGLGVGAFCSCVAPLPTVDGDNPFAWRSGMTGKGLTQALWFFVGLVVMAIIAVPSLIPAIVFDDRPWVWALPVAGAALGTVVFLGATRLAARRLASRGPDLIADVSVRALT